MTDLFNFHRRPTIAAQVGDIAIGGDNKIRLQSMTTTSTDDTDASVRQAERIIDAGGELVRLTTQGVREAENLKNISSRLRRDGYDAPLVADVHFNPHVADIAALYAEKVRINPGNYIDPARRFIKREYTDSEYTDELSKIDARLTPFLSICRSHHTAIRIGVNHGSLSDRIRNRYGDTPRGIVESCMEFLRVCRREHFDDVVVSVKSSNTVAMVIAVRQLIAAMDSEDMHYPLHLGVTEAGEGADGRIKSAVGIGALLADGIGDTIRVSLSEEPEKEIPVARQLVDHFSSHHTLLGAIRSKVLPVDGTGSYDYFNPTSAVKRSVEYIGGNNPVTVVSDMELRRLMHDHPATLFVAGNALPEEYIESAEGEYHPVVLRLCYDETDKERFQLTAAADAGAPAVDRLFDALCLVNPSLPDSIVEQTAYDILQASRLRMTKTEYISCPGCGRTLYDLRSTVSRIKTATRHLNGLKIAVMGCIVNGPGEMADADYGYVGAGPGRVSLYRRLECVERNIPEEKAVEHLLHIIEKERE